MNDATKPRRKWVGKTLLIICICMFGLMIISIATFDEAELLAELDETKADLARVLKEHDLSKKELASITRELEQLKNERVQDQSSQLVIASNPVQPDDKIDTSTETSSTALIEETQNPPVILAKEDIYDGPIKTQIDQRWYVTEAPRDENALRKLIQDLHKKALKPRSTFEHHNPANAVYLYVYADKETAETEQFGVEWLGMSSMSAQDSADGVGNEVSIKSDRLTKYLAEPEVRHGLQETLRRKIYIEWGKGIKNATAAAKNEDGRVEDFDLHLKLEQEFGKQLQKKYGISEDQWNSIFIEGMHEGFSQKTTPNETAAAFVSKIEEEAPRAAKEIKEIDPFSTQTYGNCEVSGTRTVSAYDGFVTRFYRLMCTSNDTHNFVKFEYSSSESNKIYFGFGIEGFVHDNHPSQDLMRVRCKVDDNQLYRRTFVYKQGIAFLSESKQDGKKLLQDFSVGKKFTFEFEQKHGELVNNVELKEIAKAVKDFENRIENWTQH